MVEKWPNNFENAASPEKPVINSVNKESKSITDVAKSKIARLTVGISMLAATANAADMELKKNNTQQPVEDSKIEMMQKADHVKIETEKARNELLLQLDGDEYLQKMKKEFDGDELAAKSEVGKRKKILETVNISVVKANDIKNIILKQIDIDLESSIQRLNTLKIPTMVESAKKNAALQKEITNSADYYQGYYNKALGVFIAYDSAETGHAGSATHELSHAMTEGGLTVPIKTENLLREAFESDSPDVFNEYFSSYDEMLARKKELDRDLERLGIKDYGELATDEHIEEIMQSYEKKELSDGSMQLIKYLKKSYIKKILNEIACNENESVIFVG